MVNNFSYKYLVQLSDLRKNIVHLPKVIPQIRICSGPERVPIELCEYDRLSALNYLNFLERTVVLNPVIETTLAPIAYNTIRVGT